MAKVEIVKEALKCERCGHIWIPRKKEIRLCPHCKTAWWDRPRKGLVEC